MDRGPALSPKNAFLVPVLIGVAYDLFQVQRQADAGVIPFYLVMFALMSGLGLLPLGALNALSVVAATRLGARRSFGWRFGLFALFSTLLFQSFVHAAAAYNSKRGGAWSHDTPLDYILIQTATLGLCWVLFTRSRGALQAH